MSRPTASSLSAPSAVSAGKIVSALLSLETRGTGFSDITHEAAKFLRSAGAHEGALTLFIRHTSASLTIQENADPSVLVDLDTALRRLAPEDGGWVHDTEGPDDMAAHARSVLTSNSLSIPVTNGKLGLGTWQGLYLYEHRTAPHARSVVVTVMGDA